MNLIVTKQTVDVKRKNPVNQLVTQCFGLFRNLIFFFYTDLGNQMYSGFGSKQYFTF